MKANWHLQKKNWESAEGSLIRSSSLYVHFPELIIINTWQLISYIVYKHAEFCFLFYVEEYMWHEHEDLYKPLFPSTFPNLAWSYWSKYHVSVNTNTNTIWEIEKWVTVRWRNREGLSCKQVVLRVCNCQWGAVINKLCDSSYRHHLLWHTHTYTHTHSSDHGIPLGYKSPGRTCVQLQHPSGFPLLFNLCSSAFNLCSFRSLSHLPFHIHSASLLTISLPVSFSPPSVLPSPLGLPFSKWQIYSESDMQWKAYGDRCVQRGSLCCHMAWWRV